MPPCQAAERRRDEERRGGQQADFPYIITWLAPFLNLSLWPQCAPDLGCRTRTILQRTKMPVSLPLKPIRLYAIVIHMTETSPTTSVLSVRVNPDERAILEAAAEQAHTTLSDFMRRKALEAAEVDVLNRTIITIPAKDWEQFETWIARPSVTVPALKQLGAITPSWER